MHTDGRANLIHLYGRRCSFTFQISLHHNLERLPFLRIIAKTDGKIKIAQVQIPFSYVRIQQIDDFLVAFVRLRQTPAASNSPSLKTIMG